MVQEHREEGQGRGVPLGFASWVEHFLGSRGELLLHGLVYQEDRWIRAPRGTWMSQSFQGESWPVITTCDGHRCCFGLSIR